MVETDLYREFGRRVAVRRRELGMTQAALSAQVGLSRPSIANIERGEQKLALHQVYRLSEVLRFRSLSDLLPPITQDANEPAGPAPIDEPEEGLTELQRRQVESIYHNVDHAT